MITRFDHCVIGAQDLDDAINTFQRLGFDVRPGGRHTGLGTHNALIRFGLDYLELLATHDPLEAAGSGRSGQTIMEFLHDRPGGLLGFALASNNLDDEYARGYAANRPYAMERARPDHRVLSWRLLVPGEHTWRRPWPFLIQWDTPDAERLEWDGVGQHANGATGVAGVSVAAQDTAALAQLYRDQLGLKPDHQRVDLPDHRTIDFRQDPVEGLMEVQLHVSDLATSRDWFQSHGIRTEDRSAKEFAISPEAALGAQLVFCV